MSVTADGYEDDFMGFCRDVLGPGLPKPTLSGRGGRTQLGKIETRKALDEGQTVTHCTGRCSLCNGPSTRTIRHEKIAGKWSRVEVEICINSQVGLARPVNPDRRCPDIRTVI